MPQAASSPLLRRLFSLLLLLSIYSASCPLAAASFSAAGVADELSVVAHPAKLILPPGRPVEGSPGARPGAALACSRVRISGLSRLRNPEKYAHALKVRVSVSHGDALFRVQTIELCFHKNESIHLGMCPADQWQKLLKDSWVRMISPYEHRILDIRMLPDPSRSIEVSTEEEFLLHRLVFLVLGFIMMLAARTLSESVVFYYGGAMTLGIILVILMILFQGMKLLPTGRKSSLAIFAYSSIVGVGTFLLHYLSGLLRTFLVEIGISEDMHNPLGILLLVCLALAGAWFGYWGVQKLVLTEEGFIDSSVAVFVEWAIMIFSAVLVLQSSLDLPFALVALILNILILALTRRSRFLRRLYRRMIKNFHRTRGQSSESKFPHADFLSHQNVAFISPNSRAGRYKMAQCDSPISGLINTPLQRSSDDHYSTYHQTPERKRFSKEEWNTFTKEETDKGVRQLVSSPEFSSWLSANLDRVVITPREHKHEKRRRLFRWF